MKTPLELAHNLATWHEDHNAWYVHKSRSVMAEYFHTIIKEAFEEAALAVRLHRKKLELSKSYDSRHLDALRDAESLIADKAREILG